MTDEKNIGKNVARYGAVEYEQKDHEDWRIIADLELFCKAVFISPWKKSDHVMKSEDYDKALRILTETFLDNPVSGQYEIVYCPDEQKPPSTDWIFIRLVWSVFRKEPNKLNLVKYFVALSYFYALGEDKPEIKKKIVTVQKDLAKNWIIQLKSLYERYARGTHGGTYALAEQCHIIDNCLKNALRDNSGPFSKQAK